MRLSAARNIVVVVVRSSHLRGDLHRYNFGGCHVEEGRSFI